VCDYPSLEASRLFVGPRKKATPILPDKLEQVVLALLHMNSFKERDGRRAWEKPSLGDLGLTAREGYISDPATKNKSVWLTDEGAKLSEELFEKLFGAT
jgi:hypothetical protein